METATLERLEQTGAQVVEAGYSPEALQTPENRFNSITDALAQLDTTNPELIDTLNAIPLAKDTGVTDKTRAKPPVRSV
jgi:hypothetical protein